MASQSSRREFKSRCSREGAPGRPQNSLAPSVSAQLVILLKVLHHARSVKVTAHTLPCDRRHIRCYNRRERRRPSRLSRLWNYDTSELPKLEGRRPLRSCDWVRGRPPDAILAFSYAAQVRQASAFLLLPRAIAAIAGESPPRGPAGIAACRRWSTSHRARNAPWYERLLPMGRLRMPRRQRIPAGSGRAFLQRTIQKKPRNWGWRIWAEDLGPWRFSILVKKRLRHCRDHSHEFRAKPKRADSQSWRSPVAANRS